MGLVYKELRSIFIYSKGCNVHKTIKCDDLCRYAETLNTKY